MRISFNINAQSIRDINTLDNVIRQTRPNACFIMDGIGLAERFYPYLSGDKIMISRYYSTYNNQYWLYVSPKEAIREIKSKSNGKHRQYYHSVNNEPAILNTNGQVVVGELVSWMIELMDLAYDEGIRLAIGELAVDKNIRKADVRNGVWDPFLKALDRYRGHHIMSIHEYTNILLPFQFMNKSPQELTVSKDRATEIAQPGNWVTDIDRGWRYIQQENGNSKKEFPPFWHLLRVEWLQLRAQEIGIERLDYIITEGLWDRKSDWDNNHNGALNELDRQYDTSARGINSLKNFWKEWFPQWSYSESAMQQLAYADKIVYDESCKGIMLFAWNQNWRKADHDFSDPELSELWNLMIQYSNGEFDFVLDGFDSGNDNDDQPTTLPDDDGGETEIDEVDTLQYLMGDGRVYDLRYEFPGLGTGIERIQTQTDGRRFYHVKGSPEATSYYWEELWYTPSSIWRGTDTSPNENQYYQVKSQSSPYRNNYGTKWIPRIMQVGDISRNETSIVFKSKSDGSVEIEPYPFNFYIELHAVHDSYTFKSGVKLDDVIELWGYVENNGQRSSTPFEKYWYAKGYGLVAWKDPNKNWHSYITNLNVNQSSLNRQTYPAINLPDVNPKEIALEDERWERIAIETVGSYTNVRSLPTVRSESIYRLRECENVLIITGFYENQADGRWYPIRLGEDFEMFGWIRQDVYALCDDDNNDSSNDDSTGDGDTDGDRSDDTGNGNNGDDDSTGDGNSGGNEYSVITIRYKENESNKLIVTIINFLKTLLENGE